MYDCSGTDPRQPIHDVGLSSSEVIWAGNDAGPRPPRRLFVPCLFGNGLVNELAVEWKSGIVAAERMGKVVKSAAIR